MVSGRTAARQCSSDSRFADRLLAGEAIGMCETTGALMSLQNRDGSLVSGDGRKTSSNSRRIAASPRCWHGAHLNKSFLDRARTHSYPVGVSRQRGCQLVGIVAYRHRPSQSTS